MYHRSYMLSSHKLKIILRGYYESAITSAIRLLFSIKGIQYIFLFTRLSLNSIHQFRLFELKCKRMITTICPVLNIQRYFSPHRPGMYRMSSKAMSPVYDFPLVASKTICNINLNYYDLNFICFLCISVGCYNISLFRISIYFANVLIHSLWIMI